MAKFKSGYKVIFNVGDLYSDAARQEFKQYGLEENKIYTIDKVEKDMLYIKELIHPQLKNGWHESWWILVPKKKSKRPKYKKFLEKLSSLSDEGGNE